MTDTAAIRARHVSASPAATFPLDRAVWCAWCHDPWPCDAHQLGVALEAITEAGQRMNIEYDARLDAAEAREQRLRADIKERAEHLSEQGDPCAADLLALATEAER